MLGILCGLRDEAVIAEKITGAKIACAAAVPQKARALARGLIEQGATRLMSFGVAGALDPSLPVGALVIGDKVIAPNGKWDCDAVWTDHLLKALPDAHCCDVWGSETLVARAADKTGLFQKTGCAIVDMESQCAAEAAAAAHVPFAVVRVVCDKATHNVPPLVMAAINADGSTNWKNVVHGLFHEPLEVFDLIKVGFNMKKSFKVLDQLVPNLG